MHERIGKKVGIIGKGWVGKAMLKLFPDAVVHDILEPNEEAYRQEAIFICVPTPLLPNGTLDTSVVEESVGRCSLESLIIIRSTVNPGTCDKLQEKYGENLRLVYQPEYLGETPNHPMLDMRTRPFLILGGNQGSTRMAIELYQTVYNANVSIRQTTLREAEVIKLSENRAIAFKVMQCQELFDACEADGTDYYTVRDAVYGDDPRFNLWFTFIYGDKRGFNSSKCLVKDVPAWCAWAESTGAGADITKLLVERSNQYEKSS